MNPPPNRPVIRRGSIGGSMRRVNSMSSLVEPSTPADIKSEILNLRQKTQEALQHSRDETDRLQAENDSKNDRIRELLDELKNLERQRGQKGPASAFPAMAAKALEGMGNLLKQTASLRPGSDHGDCSDNGESPDPSLLPSGDSINRGTSPVTIPKLARVARLKSVSVEDKKVEEEAAVMDHLASLEKENKRMLQELHQDLLMKEDQVNALEMTSQSQLKTISKLREKIAAIRTTPQSRQKSPSHLSSENSALAYESADKLNSQDSELAEHILDLETRLRFIKRIRSMNESESTECMSELNEKIGKVKQNLEHVKKESQEKMELTKELLRESKKRSHLAEIRLGLMKRVSFKCLRRAEKKAMTLSSSEHVDEVFRQIKFIVDRAEKALTEEIQMRGADKNDVKFWIEQTADVENLAGISIKCADTLLDEAPRFLDDQNSFDQTEVIAMRSALNDAVKVVENSKIASLSLIAKLLDAVSLYEKDMALLPEHLAETMWSGIDKKGKERLLQEAAGVAAEESPVSPSEALENKAMKTIVLAEQSQLESIQSIRTQLEEVRNKVSVTQAQESDQIGRMQNMLRKENEQDEDLFDCTLVEIDSEVPSDNSYQTRHSVVSIPGQVRGVLR